MLYPLRVVSEDRTPLPPLLGSDTPAARFLELACVLSRLFGVSPTVLRLPGSRTLTLLYRNAVYLTRDVVECTSPYAAALSGAVWPLWFYGTTEARETAEWTISAPDAGTAAVRLRSVSGAPFDHLEGLGLRVDLPDRNCADALEELCETAPFLPPCAVLLPGCVPLLTASPLLAHVRDSRFSYLAWEPLPARELLSALTADHKAALWREFLDDGLQPPEFDWLWELYYTGEPLLLLEWELALRMVLEELGFQVERSERSFHILDRAGRGRRFDFARGGPAEKVFLKLLFPLDAK